MGIQTEQLWKKAEHLNCLPAGSKSSLRVVQCSRAHCAAWIAPYHRSELQLGGGAPPCDTDGLLGFLINSVEVKAAHKQRACARLQRAVGSVNGRICEEGALLCSTCSMRERRAEAHRELHHESAVCGGTRMRATCTSNPAHRSHHVCTCGSNQTYSVKFV